MHYVLIVGIAALLPDIDYIYYYFSHAFFGVQETIHPVYTHNLLIPVIILIAAFIFKKRQAGFLEKKNKIGFIFLLIASGYLIHLFLDFIAYDSISLLPLSKSYGLGLIPQNQFGISLIAGLDAIILILWLWHEEAKHKIRDFI